MCPKALMVIMVVSWVYTDSPSHELVYMKYVQLFMCKSYLNKVFFLKECFSLVFPEADLKAKTQVQVVYVEVRQT